MTLITYPVRAHFADGVLEEALRSELETHHFDAPLVISDVAETGSEFSERLFSSFPRGYKPVHYAIPAHTRKSDAASEVRALASYKQPNVLIAYGSARAIEYARKCRQVLQQDHPSKARIDLFAIPGVDGLPGPCRKGCEPGELPSDLSIRMGLPTILICDPTVTLGADPAVSARAAVTTLVQCLEAYLSTAFNPPADGMALDGLHRVAQMLPHLRNETLEVRRELMAAAFNAMLCQQKGVGPAQVIGEALKAIHNGDLNAHLAAGLLLPGVLRSQDATEDKRDLARKMLNFEEETHLPEGLAKLLMGIQMPQSLSELGVVRSDMVRVASNLSDRLTLPARSGGGDVMEIMEAVF
ncbi:MAG: iron-containing alcohol dehydrogenase [Paracoccaceae bacterium]|nr:iron-containing alcohol dehydrogenase [Paracoccaceae bacterium]